MLNRQEMFDKVWNHFKKWNFETCRKDNGRCMYLRKDGHMCAVGCLLPNNYNFSSIENMTIKQICDFDKNIANFFEYDFEFFVKLQRFHDTSQDSEHFKENLEHFAIDYALNIPVN